MTEHWEAMKYGVTSSLYARELDSFDYDFVALLSRTFLSLCGSEMRFVSCWFSGALLNLALGMVLVYTVSDKFAFTRKLIIGTYAPCIQV